MNSKKKKRPWENPPWRDGQPNSTISEGTHGNLPRTILGGIFKETADGVSERNLCRFSDTTFGVISEGSHGTILEKKSIEDWFHKGTLGQIYEDIS